MSRLEMLMLGEGGSLPIDQTPEDVAADTAVAIPNCASCNETRLENELIRCMTAGAGTIVFEVSCQQPMIRLMIGSVAAVDNHHWGYKPP